MVTRAKIVKIGNSQGLRIPKLFLEQTGISGNVELEARSGEIVIRAERGVRNGWGDAFSQMAARGDDSLLDDSESAIEWDDEEWVWE